MSRTSTRTFTRDGGEVEVEVEFDWTPGSPAVTSGPPECCDPGESPEIENLRATLIEDAEDGSAKAGDAVTLTPEEEGRFVEEVLEDPDALDDSNDYDERDYDDER